MSYRVQGRMLIRTVKGKVRANLLSMGYLPHGPVTTFWGKNAEWKAIAPHILKTKYHDIGEDTRVEVFPTGVASRHSVRPGSKFRRTVFPTVTTYHLAKYNDYGGYPLFYVTADNQCLCADCATEQSTKRHLDWPKIVAVDANYEDPDLYCAHCSERIESAYADAA